MEQIIWKDINLEGFENYEVSNQGSVRNKTTNKEIGYNNPRGYMMMKLYSKTGKLEFRVHRLVAITFKPIPLEEFNKLHVHHIDGNTLNNRPENLKYLTIREHMLEEIRLGNNITGLRGKDSLTFKGVIGKFDKEGYLLDIYCGQKELERDGYSNGDIYSIINRTTGRKIHRGFYWRRFPKDSYPQIGVKYNLEDSMFDTEVYKKRKVEYVQLDLSL